MPELPEILSRAGEMDQALRGKTIRAVHVAQPKSLNLPEGEFVRALVGARIASTTCRGKWLFNETSQGWLCLNMGMGGEILLVSPQTLPEKRRLVFDFDDGTCLAINFWWFGYAHYIPLGALDSHKMTRDLGPNANEVSADELWAMTRGKRSRLKTYLLDQTRLAGIGNAYIHDILFLAGLHPLRTLDSLSQAEVEKLAGAIRDGLQPAIDKGGAFYEMNLFGQPGGFGMQDILVGYREGQPCPRCATPIVKIKTGSNSSFVCETCQPL